MADIILANSTYAVGTSDSATAVVNNVTVQDAQQINGPVSAILQIESVLGNGLDLVGSHSDLASRLAVSIAADGTLVDESYPPEPGDICASIRSSKTGWLLMDNTERSNTTYPALFTQILPRLSTNSTYALRVGTGRSVTVDHTTDTFTASSHGIGNNNLVYLVASSYPGGTAALTAYYVINATTNTFQISATQGGVALALSSNGSSVVVFTTFIADVRGTTLLGADNMGGSSRGVATDSAADLIGATGGSESSVAAHTHTYTSPDAPIFNAAGGAQPSVNGRTTGVSTSSTGTSTGNMMPYTTVNYFIKY